MINSVNTTISAVSVFVRGHASVSLEKLMEHRLVGKVQPGDNLLDRHRGIFEHTLGLQYDK